MCKRPPALDETFYKPRLGTFLLVHIFVELDKYNSLSEYQQFELYCLTKISLVSIEKPIKSPQIRKRDLPRLTFFLPVV